MSPEITATITALKEVTNSRFHATERGYQGAFYCALRSALEQMNQLTKDRILEMEYQKSARHGLSQRPDILFHIPREISRASARDNNYGVWALKHDANSTDAIKDFEKLDDMCAILEYPLAIFVNVASAKTHLDSYSGRFAGRIHAFAVLKSKVLKIQYSYFDKGVLVTRQL